MRIRLSELPEAVRRPTTPPPSVRPGSVIPRDAVSVMLSSEVRQLVAGLARGLPEVGAMDLYEILSHEDRRMIALASELAATQGLDPAQVELLASDLVNYAMSSAVSAPASAASKLTLPVLSAHDEALARDILAQISARNLPLNVGFVQAMLEPSAPRTVSLEFLRRVVLTMATTQSPPGTWARAVYARREARSELAQAVAKLGITPSALGPATAQVVVAGSVLLRERVEVIAQQTVRSAWSTLTQLTRNDRALAGMLYVAQQARGGDPRVVDDVVRSLLVLRGLERAAPVARNTEAPRAPSLAPGRPADWMRSYGSETQLAARALGAYRSLTPPSFEGELVNLPPQPSLELARALGLSELIGGVHAQSLRLRRSILLRARTATLATIEAQREQGADVESQDTAAAARHARWRRLARRRRRAAGR
jgi:hypothetical protein